MRPYASSYPKCTRQEKARIDKMASDMANWTMLGQAQLDTLGETPEVRDVAFQSLVDTGIASNNKWRPKKEDAGNYISQCADICAKTPTTADESALVAHAALSAGWALLDYQIAHESERVQIAFIERYSELVQQAMSLLPDTPAVDMDTNWGSAGTGELQTARPHTTPKVVDTGELKSFMGQPDLLHGKKFLLSPNTEDEIMFEVVSYTRARDKTLRFEILFEDCDDSLMIEQKEMKSMLEDCHTYPSIPS